ncbi:hypothetical protein OAS95_02700 [Pelagibacteraceae bacterium]|nr:hypothetical protein [Pelagibacteraceae bacterium]
MANNLSHNLEKLKSTFHNILLLRNDVTKIKKKVNNKIMELKTIYGELSKNTTKKALLFSLDSFFFQYKLFSVELENIDRFRILLNNRMYCDYYKLYILIVNYIKDNTDDLNADKIDFHTFPPYKDLEPFQEYNLDDIKHIHEDIMKYINFLYECYEINQTKITNYNGKTRIGFSISNLLNTLEHENIVLKQQMALYINYLSFFHISQTKHLKNILQRLKDFDNEIEENVNGNHAYSVDDVEEADSIRKFDYNESDDENPILTDIEPIFDDTSVSVDSVSDVIPCTKKEDVNILLIPDISDNISPTPAPTPTSVSTNSDTESTS